RPPAPTGMFRSWGPRRGSDAGHQTVAGRPAQGDDRDAAAPEPVEAAATSKASWEGNPYDRPGTRRTGGGLHVRTGRVGQDDGRPAAGGRRLCAVVDRRGGVEPGVAAAAASRGRRRRHRGGPPPPPGRAGLGRGRRRGGLLVLVPADARRLPPAAGALRSGPRARPPGDAARGGARPDPRPDRGRRERGATHRRDRLVLSRLLRAALTRRRPGGGPAPRR